MVSRRSTSATCRQRHNRYTARLSTKPVQIKIEHRLFSFISMNWRGKPLTSHEVVVNLIGATTNNKGLKVHAERDARSYPLKVTVTKTELEAVPLTRHEFHGDWNYTVHPAKDPPQNNSVVTTFV